MDIRADWVHDDVDGSYSERDEMRLARRVTALRCACLVFDPASDRLRAECTAMAKTYHTNKQSKKKALLTPKEKKAKKLAKKHATDVVPLIHH